MIELFSLDRGSLNLLIILSMIRSDTVVDRVSSAWVRNRKATERIAAHASVGSLKARAVVNKMSDNLALEFSLLFKIHPLFSSQVQASFADEMGLGAARICASRSARGEKLRGFWVDVAFWLKLEARVVDRGPLFCFEESLIGLVPTNEGLRLRTRVERRGKEV